MNKPLQPDSIHTGSTFESFLEEEGILKEVQSAALKRLAKMSKTVPKKPQPRPLSPIKRQPTI